MPGLRHHADRPLRILMVAPTSFFSDYGGHIRILEETLALQRLGHAVTIVTYFKGRDLPALDVRRTAPLPYHTDYEVGSSRHKFAFDAYLAVTTVREAWRVRPDIVHGHMHEGALIGAPIARALRAPLVFDFQGSLTGEMLDHGFLRPGGRRHAFFRRLERWISHLPAATLTSSLQARAIQTDQFGVPANAIHALPDCVDLNRFDPARLDPARQAALRRRWGIPDGVPVVAYLGLLADYQGTHHLVQAAARLKAEGQHVHFLVMGYPNVDRYATLAEDAGVADRMTFTGKVPYDAAPLHLSLGDIAVSAKMSATEGSGKVLNYMALGLPIVAYDTPVHREYLADLGTYAPAGDVTALAAALGGLAADPGRRADLGAALRQRAAEAYDWSHAARRIEALYYRLLGQL